MLAKFHGIPHWALALGAGAVAGVALLHKKSSTATSSTGTSASPSFGYQSYYPGPGFSGVINPVLVLLGAPSTSPTSSPTGGGGGGSSPVGSGGGSIPPPPPASPPPGYTSTGAPVLSFSGSRGGIAQQAGVPAVPVGTAAFGNMPTITSVANGFSVGGTSFTGGQSNIGKTANQVLGGSCPPGSYPTLINGAPACV